MTSKAKTLYDILGLDKNAEDKDIKLAFRRLARSLHPDINKADDADEKFQEIQEAFEILSNAELKKEYDSRLASGNMQFERESFEDIFQMFFGKKWTPNEAVNGEHIEVSINVTAEQLLRGAACSVAVKRRVTCTDCDGFGSKLSKDHCPECKGEGSFKKEKRTPFGKIDTREKCVTCSGSGKKESTPCKTCSEKGYITSTEEFDFQLDPTALFGDTIVFKHKGHAGKGGGVTGDLKVFIKQSPYDKVEVAYETDLREQKTVPLRMFLDGSEYKVVFPDGTEQMIPLTLDNNGNHQLFFPEKGLFGKDGKRGAYNLNIVTGIPKLSAKQQGMILKALEAE